jgi:hypothetical protein
MRDCGPLAPAGCCSLLVLVVLSDLTDVWRSKTGGRRQVYIFVAGQKGQVAHRALFFFFFPFFSGTLPVRCLKIKLPPLTLVSGPLIASASLLGYIFFFFLAVLGYF